LQRPAHSLRFVQDKVRGKPRLHDTSRESVDFNLTHARGLSACVVGLSCIVGIDAEPSQRHIDDEVLSLYAAAQELEPPERLASGAARLSLWTLKEALVKAVGEGLDIDLRQLHVSLDPPRLLIAPAELGQPSEWHLVHWRAGPHHVASIAYRCAAPVLIEGLAER
jgi:4'-phosphopantetheinyl transferase